MSDPIAAAFGGVPIPEPRPDFERRVVAQAMAGDRRRLRRVRVLFRAYWVSAMAISAAALSSTELSAAVMVTATAALVGTTAAAVVAAGGMRSMTRVLRTTIS
jgi:hypothetical protein